MSEEAASSMRKFFARCTSDRGILSKTYIELKPKSNSPVSKETRDVNR